MAAPFIGRLHGQPHDYRRYSEFGLRWLLVQHHLTEVLIWPLGGFLTTQCLLWSFYLYESVHAIRFPLLKAPAYLLLYGALIGINVVSVCVYHLDRERLTPHNYLAVAQKPGASRE